MSEILSSIWPSFKGTGFVSKPARDERMEMRRRARILHRLLRHSVSLQRATGIHGSLCVKMEMVGACEGSRSLFVLLPSSSTTRLIFRRDGSRVTCMLVFSVEGSRWMQTIKCKTPPSFSLSLSCNKAIHMYRWAGSSSRWCWCAGSDGRYRGRSEPAALGTPRWCSTGSISGDMHSRCTLKCISRKTTNRGVRRRLKKNADKSSFKWES